MHIPDNYLSPSTCAVMAAAMAPVLAVSVRKAKAEMTKAKMPMLGICAAFSFIVMMFNVPVPGGTTVHAIGGTLIAILLGPFSACISLTIALLIQALLFGDGGIVALGANMFNIAFVLPFVGYFVYTCIKNRVASERGEYIGALVGSYVGINVSACIAAIEFGIQPLLFHNAAGQALYCPYPLQVSIPAMLIPHLLVAGFVEAFFTVSMLTFIKKVSPGSLYEGEIQRSNAIYALLAVLICLVPLGLLAEASAWGEWGADAIGSVVSQGAALGYVPEGMLHGFKWNTLMEDYAVAGLPASFGYILSAVCGAAITVILFRIAGSFIKDKKQHDAVV